MVGSGGLVWHTSIRFLWPSAHLSCAYVPLGHNMAAPPPISPPLSRQEEGEGDRGQRRQPLFECAFPEGLPTPLLASGHPCLQRGGEMGTLSLPQRWDSG